MRYDPDAEMPQHRPPNLWDYIAVAVWIFGIGALVGAIFAAQVIR